MELQPYHGELETEVRERFLRYVQVHTTSDRHSGSHPSSPRQFDLAYMLEKELKELGLTDVTVTEHCYVIARIPASSGVEAPTVAFLAHMDTAPDSSGENVHPRIWEAYDGGVLEIGNGLTLDPSEYPDLRDFIGETLITTDGSTLLGADDKAGVAEIMTAVAFIMAHPEVRHPEVEIIFTPDEEIGQGVDYLPVEELHAHFAYTMDGGKEGSIEAECFSAYRLRIEIDGYVIHPGSARGKMANAVSIASRLIAVLPQNESPEATDGRYGFYCPVEVSGDYGHATIDIIVRDFETDEVLRRVEYVKQLARTMELAYPRSSITVNATKQYLNMRDRIDVYPFLTKILTEAIEATGIEPILDPIRGGTDGARLTEMGLPTPNIYAGGLNFHGPLEWIPVRSLRRATETILTILDLWSERVGSETPLPEIVNDRR